MDLSIAGGQLPFRRVVGRGLARAAADRHDRPAHHEAVRRQARGLEALVRAGPRRDNADAAKRDVVRDAALVEAVENRVVHAEHQAVVQQPGEEGDARAI